MRDSSVKRWSAVHRSLYRLTGGRIGRRLVGNNMLLLTTRGRKTGAPHTVPLLYLRDEETMAVIASYGGRDHHPEWYLNLLDDPSVAAQTGDRTVRLTARTASGVERATWWPRAVATYQDYAVYQSRTRREIPIVLLEPAP
ncbi:MAG TPA: nitroreductase family deazaflavin-dependent oxidoreductase [Acidimicrobiia bacterium]|nr:nitroreductase family deazaflavin-dependent oxidoreductase [Acidimicrobiia bacterium]